MSGIHERWEPDKVSFLVCARCGEVLCNSCQGFNLSLDDPTGHGCEVVARIEQYDETAVEAAKQFLEHGGFCGAFVLAPEDER